MLRRSGLCMNLEAFCCGFLSLFPKVFVLTVLLWALYGTVSELHSHLGLSAASLVFSGLLLSLYLLSMYSYFQVVVVGPGSPLDFPELRLTGASTNDHYLLPELNEQNETLLSPRRAPPMEVLVTHTIEKGEPYLRWCPKCNVWKPDRCHHCSNCKRCFLQMDHHCPWFSCCIGFRNHKFFIQFLLYVFVFCGYVLAISLYFLYDFFVKEQYAEHQYLSLTLVFLAVVSFAFFLSVGCFAGFLVYLMLRNLTTIEFQDLRWNYLGDHSAEYEYDSTGKKKSVANFYDLGLKRNWTAVMGDTWWHWLLPISATDEKLTGYKNGLNFEVDEEVFDKYCQNLQLQDRLNAQLMEYRDQLRGRRNQ